MASKNNKTKTIKIVNSMLKEYLISKKFSESEADNQADLLFNDLCREIWDMNKKRITEDLEEKNNIKICHLEEELKKEYKKKDNMKSYKKMVNLLFEGVFVATLVGLVVNQITDLIGIFKKFLFESSKVEIWLSTIIIIITISLILTCIIGKYFVDKIRELYNEIYK